MIAAEQSSAGPQMSQRVPSAGLYDNYMDDQSAYMAYSMYPTNAPMGDIWDLADEKNLLVSSFDGLHSGVPTRTTPTLTPTTLRSIEQTFLEFTSEPGSHSREAGFVPPLIEPSQPTPAQTQVAQNQQVIHEAAAAAAATQQSQHTGSSSPSTTSSTSSTRRNMGGRRPTRTVGMTPEEEERRQIRRERNKMAAARCRKRRMDHTNALLEETDGLEAKRQSLKDEIQQLQQAKDELEFMLEAHRPVCRIQQSSSPPDVKPVIQEQNKQQQQQQQQHQGSNGGGGVELQPEEFSDLGCNGKQPEDSTSNGLCNGRLNRPNSLPIATFTEPKPRPSSLQFKSVETPAFMKSISEVAGIPITTPSAGIFNFDSLMEGGTGLTPVTTPLVPSCSSQQRSNGIAANHSHHHHHNNNSHSHHQQQQHHHHGHPLSAVDLSSPDANPPKLVSL